MLLKASLYHRRREDSHFNEAKVGVVQDLTKENIEIYNFQLEAGNQALLFTYHEGTADEESVTIILNQEQVQKLRQRLKGE